MFLSGSYNVLNESYTPIDDEHSNLKKKSIDAGKSEGTHRSKLKNPFKYKMFSASKSSIPSEISLACENLDLPSKKGLKALNSQEGKTKLKCQKEPTYKSFLFLNDEDDVFEARLDYDSNETLPIGIMQASKSEGELPDASVSSLKQAKVSILKHIKSILRPRLSEIRIKIILIGDANAGKSSIISRFINGTFEATQSAEAIGYETKFLKLGSNRRFCLHIFEASGDISTAILSPTCISDAVGAMIVFDIKKSESYKSIVKWKSYLEIRSDSMNIDNIPCVLLANKCDADDISFDMCELDNLCAREKIAAWFDTSAKNDFNIKNAFAYLIQHIIKEHHDLKDLHLLDIDRRTCCMNGGRMRFKKRNELDDEECTTML